MLGFLNSASMGVSIGAAVFYGLQVRAPPSNGRTITKTLSTALLSATSALSGGPHLLTAALAFSSIGDAFLARDDADPNFLGGLSSFLIAHICYTLLFFHHGGVDVLSDQWRSALALGMLLLAPAMVGSLAPRVGRLLWLPVMIYSAAILGMVLAALRMASDQIVGGAILFAASDSLLSADKFLIASASWHRGWMQHAVWALYYSGQFLIARGVLGFIE